MDTTKKSIQNEQTPTWANVVSSRIKPPDKNKKSENKFIPVSLFKTTTENAKKIEITYKEKKLDLLETTEYSDEFKNITIPSYSGLSVWEVAHKAHKELSKIGE
ncbi:hypothetical protein AYI70_g6543, partial [Smittium culicis]